MPPTDAFRVRSRRMWLASPAFLVSCRVGTHCTRFSPRHPLASPGRARSARPVRHSTRTSGRGATPRGSRSQVRIVAPRAGSAASNTCWCCRTRPRDVGDSATTRSRLVVVGRHPRLPAISGASLVLRSRSCSIACRSGITDLTSTTRSERVGSCHASRSIEPRSPQIENDTSTAVVQPRRSNRATAAAIVAACAASRSRSRCLAPPPEPDVQVGTEERRDPPPDP